MNLLEKLTRPDGTPVVTHIDRCNGGCSEYRVEPGDGLQYTVREYHDNGNGLVMVWSGTPDALYDEVPRDRVVCLVEVAPHLSGTRAWARLDNARKWADAVPLYLAWAAAGVIVRMPEELASQHQRWRDEHGGGGLMEKPHWWSNRMARSAQFSQGLDFAAGMVLREHVTPEELLALTAEPDPDVMYAFFDAGMREAARRLIAERQAAFDEWHSCVETMRHVLKHYSIKLPAPVLPMLRSHVRAFELHGLGKEKNYES